ncbi:MAG: signal peptide peptidase SppA [Bdellovibrionales bacterium]
MRKFLSTFFTGVGILVVGGCLLGIGSMFAVVQPTELRIKKNSILFLKLDGVIMDGEKFLEKLRRYRKEDSIKGVLVQINSPGGAVGPSQEIYAELKRTREEFKKPVVVSCLSVAASGAYYAAAAADKFITTPGCMVGSIGVIMEFANLEKLFDWAKVSRYSIKTGKFKDTGAEYRGMTEEERQLMQGLVNDVLVQFKSDIVNGRKMKPEVVDYYADGRVFTGAMAVKYGFADQTGTLDDAKKVVGEMVGLGAHPELFKPRSWSRDDWRMFFEEEESSSKMLHRLMDGAVGLQMRGQPLLIWPGALGI